MPWNLANAMCTSHLVLPSESYCLEMASLLNFTFFGLLFWFLWEMFLYLYQYVVSCCSRGRHIVGTNSPEATGNVANGNNRRVIQSNLGKTINPCILSSSRCGHIHIILRQFLLPSFQTQCMNIRFAELSACERWRQHRRFSELKQRGQRLTHRADKIK